MPRGACQRERCERQARRFYRRHSHALVGGVLALCFLAALRFSMSDVEGQDLFDAAKLGKADEVPKTQIALKELKKGSGTSVTIKLDFLEVNFNGPLCCRFWVGRGPSVGDSLRSLMFNMMRFGQINDPFGGLLGIGRSPSFSNLTSNVSVKSPSSPII